MAVAFVTGVGGFIGSHLAKRLLEIGFTVKGCDNFSTGERDNVPEGVAIVNGNINGALNLRNTDVLFHTAAIARSGWGDESELWESNLHGTINVMKWAKHYGVQSVVYSSSCAVIAPEYNTYSKTKQLAENVANYYGAVSLRYSNVYGPGQSMKGAEPNVLAAWKRQFNVNGYITIHGDGSQTRDFIHVEDVVDANIAAMYKHSSIYDICTGYQKRLREVGEILVGSSSIRYSGQARGAHSYFQSPSRASDELGFRASRKGKDLIGTWNSL